MESTPKITVVIAAYRPGDRFDRVIASLDAQTLRQDEFETIVVDDGSPDDTFARISALKTTRPNLRVERIENSGWPSRPRNVATQLARGEWLLFMDHDDSLYPDALRRMAEYAAETDADVLSPKESKTTDAWWGMPALRDGNVPNAVVDGGIDRLLPMVPHKLYRRRFLQEHGITFPEGRRQLWEDIYVNVEAWRHAERVAVLADTPAYLWHSSDANNSKTYGPKTTEFWDRLDDLFAFIDTTLDGPAFADARRSMLLHQWRGRVLTRFPRMLRGATPAEVEQGLRRAQALQQRYVPEEWDPLLGKTRWARSILVRQGRTDLLDRLWAADSGSSAQVIAERVEWRGGELHVDLECRWIARSGAPARLVRHGSRLVRALPDELLAALPAEVTDLSDTLDDFALHVGLRDRAAHVTWEVPTTVRRSWQPVGQDAVTPAVRATLVLDPDRSLFGRRLPDASSDAVAALHWAGGSHGTAVKTSTRTAPALVGGRSVVAHRGDRDVLTVDIGGLKRDVVGDGGVPEGRVPGTITRFALPLTAAHVASAGQRRAVTVRFINEQSDRGIDVAGSIRDTSDGAVLQAGGDVPPGDYRLSLQVGEAPFRRTRMVMHVAPDGQLRLSRVAQGPAPQPSMTGTVLQRARKVRERAARLAKRVRRRLAR